MPENAAKQAIIRPDVNRVTFDNVGNIAHKEKSSLGYVSLHNHSTSSLLDGLIPPKELAAKAAEMGHEAVGLTDHGSFSGAIQLYKACKDLGIKAVPGIEAYFVDSVVPSKGERRYHICLFPKTNVGLQSLYALMSKAWQNFYYTPRFDLDMLWDAEDIIVSTACLGGILSHPNYERIIDSLLNYFEDDLYLEIMPINVEKQQEVNERAICLHQVLDIPLIATNDTHYLSKEDSEIHNFLLNINTKGNMKFEIEGLYFRDEQMMRSAFQNLEYIDGEIIEAALAETSKLAEKCNVDLQARSIKLPHLSDTPLEDLVTLAAERIPEVYPNGFEYYDRLEYEMSVIEERGFTDYFLLVSDFVDHAKEIEMELGPGRGSAAGSLTCYVLGITDIDPIKEDLSFERFMNPQRTDYPDIDIDFQQSRRHEMISYLKDKYGHDRVANISTVSKQTTTSAFKDVARKFEIPFNVANEVSSAIDNKFTFKETFEGNTTIQKLLAEFDTEKIIRFTDGIAGTLRHSGTHAAGVVVAPEPIEKFGVLEEREGITCIHWLMDDVSHVGLVKIDILGLRNLDIIAECKSLVKQRRGITVNWKEVCVDSPDILQEFEIGRCAGIFQFESWAMTNLVKRFNRIQHKNLLVDCNALVRPGPADSGMTDTYIKCHNGEHCEKEIYFPYLQEYDIASDTYSVIIYQEQVTATLTKLAGYTIPEADIIRRKIAKKKEGIEENKAAFVEGCAEIVKMPEEVSSLLFSHLETFSRYGFNKAHAAAYTELGLRCMYLKLNYPLEYMTSLFKWTDEKKKLDIFTGEAKRLGIKILPPDINDSDAKFKIDEDGIRIGLVDIKGVGDKAASQIIEYRNGKPFADPLDFRIRVPKSKANKKVMEGLIFAGAFDRLGINYRQWIEYILEEKEDISEEIEDYTDDEKLIHKLTRLPGVFRSGVKPEIGLSIDSPLLDVVTDCIAGCHNCLLRAYYDNPVTFEYTDKASIMVVAEAPGRKENEQGRPLVGDSGELLENTFLPHGILREDLFLTNVFKCRPFGNSLPENVPKDCYEYLSQEIEIVQPKIILSLGNSARQFFCGEEKGIQSAADRLEFDLVVIGKRVIPVLYTVHPASTMRQGGKANLTRFRNSIQLIADVYNGLYC
jgi:DNA polymerase III subunit alpha